MRSPSILRFLLLAPIVALLLAGPMTGRSFGLIGLITQDAGISRFGLTVVSASTNDGGTGIITRDISAEFSSLPPPPGSFGGFSAVASVGRFGAVGLQVSEFSSVFSQTGALVDISSSQINISGHPLHAIQHVVIDGGMMESVFARPGSFISYDYRLQSTIGDPTAPSTHTIFESFGELQTDSTGRLSFFVGPTGPTTSTFVDLGATFLPTAFGPSGNPISGTVTIPTTFPTFDLGVIPISGSLELDYSFTFDAFTSGGFESLLEGEFSDPFHLSTNPALGTTTFEPVGAPVPEPSTLALIGSGGLALLACARRRRARRPCVIRWLIGDFASNDSSMNKLTLTGNVP